MKLDFSNVNEYYGKVLIPINSTAQKLKVDSFGIEWFIADPIDVLTCTGICLLIDDVLLTVQFRDKTGTIYYVPIDETGFTGWKILDEVSRKNKKLNAIPLIVGAIALIAFSYYGSTQI